jgi:hypothetical protein
VNDFIILMAVDAYFDLGCELTPEMNAFSRWMAALHPDVLQAEQIAMEIRQAAQLAGLAGLSRTEQLEVDAPSFNFGVSAVESKAGRFQSVNRRRSSTGLTISRHNSSAASAGAWSRSSSVGAGATFRPTMTAAGFAGLGLGFLTRRGGRAMTMCGLSVSMGRKWTALRGGLR